MCSSPPLLSPTFFPCFYSLFYDTSGQRTGFIFGFAGTLSFSCSFGLSFWLALRWSNDGTESNTKKHQGKGRLETRRIQLPTTLSSSELLVRQEHARRFLHFIDIHLPNNHGFCVIIFFFGFVCFCGNFLDTGYQGDDIWGFLCYFSLPLCFGMGGMIHIKRSSECQNQLPQTGNTHKAASGGTAKEG
ncbi:hypothetical protein B0H63DRAFT_95543 [Podospora didyma]|uniref:Transmembrane protein n=1 Tax=Podospora didyma TaxID=330526 RepID=A0AAE0NWZ4_9PEZI|nr:hypothetical protein B0H63DRAFT_95543 [Podospora didyma]